MKAGYRFSFFRRQAKVVGIDVILLFAGNLQKRVDSLAFSQWLNLGNAISRSGKGTS